MIKYSFVLAFFVCSQIFIAQNYSYKTYKNDPTGLRLYTLDNGLTVYLAKNQDEPKIQTYIAVRAGSTYDPADNTGLAHYLEHMLFKGTDEIGSMDWEKEKKYLKEISNLYEKHKAEKNPEKKVRIYKQIDSISYIASKLAIANEYDKIVASLGAQGTNAHTWHEETVYKNKIPANELEKWLDLESERFSQLVLRLFHTELEAVYEEFNRAQDNEYRKKSYKLMDLLFPKHPYGQQTTIGTSEHLKNPSMEAIHNYFNTYYVPNNMAIVLVGDLDFDKTIKMVDQYFGKMKSKKVSKPKLPKESPMTKVVSADVSGPTAESVVFAYRFNGLGSEDHKLVTLIDYLLNNSQAGLIDLNLVQKQKVQEAWSSTTFLTDYGYHSFNGSPKEGQSLEQIRDLILEQIEKIKSGDFDEWLIDAVINDLKLGQIRRQENATAVASEYYNAFVHFEDWQDKVDFLNELKKYSKQDIVNFANEHYKNNYAIVYKRKGENSDIVKVKNPGITPIEVNREESSQYIKEFQSKESNRLSPLYINYQKEIKSERIINNILFQSIENKVNDLFTMHYVFNMGEEHNELLPLAIEYAKYLGTDTYTSEELKKEFYKLGVEYNVSFNNRRSYVTLSGLEENRNQGIKLFEHLLNNIKYDKEAFHYFVNKIKKNRKDKLTRKDDIFWEGLFELALYGKDNSNSRKLSSKEIGDLDPEKLTELIKKLTDYKHSIFYYGKDIEGAKTSLKQYHKVRNTMLEYPARKELNMVEPSSKVYFVNYDMVQSEIAFIAKDIPFNKENLAKIQVFNAYFGSGLSSIVFQEIRESKSLAYSAFSAYSTPREQNDNHIVYGYLGTQVNKLPEAVNALLKLMNNMPKAQQQFESAKESVLKKIESQRITKSSIFWNYLQNIDRGIKADNRKEIYEQVKNMKFEDLYEFFNEHIKGKKFNYIVIGNKNDLDLNALQQIGTVQEFSPNDLFVE